MSLSDSLKLRDKRNNSAFKSVNSISSGVKYVFDEILPSDFSDLRIAEIGVGIGVTTIFMATRMKGRGRLDLFDYSSVLDEVCSYSEIQPYANIVKYGNTKRVWDSYSWELLKMSASNNDEIYDFVYVDGAHMYNHDAATAAALLSLVKIGGHVLFDDYDWSIAKSKTLTKESTPVFYENFTPEQIEISHVKLVCDGIFSKAPNWKEIQLPPDKWKRILYSRTY